MRTFFYILLFNFSHVGTVYNQSYNIPSNTATSFASFIGLVNDYCAQREYYRSVSLLLELEMSLHRDFYEFMYISPCKEVGINIILDKHAGRLYSIQILSSPWKKTYKIGDVVVEYFEEDYSVFLLSNHQKIISGKIHIFSSADCQEESIAQNQKTRDALVNSAIARFEKAKQQLSERLQEMHFAGDADLQDAIYHEYSANELKVRTDRDKSKKKELQKLEKERAEIELRAGQIQEEIDQAKRIIERIGFEIYQKEKEKEHLSQNLTGVSSTLKKESSTIKELKSKIKSLESKLNGECPYASCNCPEIHGTDCHIPGYKCSDAYKIPCDDDYRCRLRKKIDRLKGMLDTHSVDETSLSTEGQSLNRQIENIDENIQNLAKIRYKETRFISDKKKDFNALEAKKKILDEKTTSIENAWKDYEERSETLLKRLEEFKSIYSDLEKQLRKIKEVELLIYRNK